MPGFGSADNSIDKSFVRGLVLSSIAIATLWWTPLLFPFRLLATTVHELSHAVASLVTGGTVQSFDVRLDGSGVVHSTGGSTIVLFSAGYLGSTLFGGTMLLVTKNAKGRRTALRLVAVATAAVLVVAGVLRALHNRSLLDLIVFTSFWAFGIVCMIVAGLELVARKAPDLVVAFVTYTIAVLSVLYAFFDLLNLFVSTVQPLGGYNDAVGLADATHVPAVLWAALWCAVAVGIVWRFLGAALRARPVGGNARLDRIP
jgi:hypothetical protein